MGWWSSSLLCLYLFMRLEVFLSMTVWKVSYPEFSFWSLIELAILESLRAVGEKLSPMFEVSAPLFSFSVILLSSSLIPFKLFFPCFKGLSFLLRSKGMESSSLSSSLEESREGSIISGSWMLLANLISSLP